MGKCGHCGNYHEGQCPKVSAIEYFPNGMVKRVEFFGDEDSRPAKFTVGALEVDQRPLPRPAQ